MLTETTMRHWHRTTKTAKTKDWHHQVLTERQGNHNHCFQEAGCTWCHCVGDWEGHGGDWVLVKAPLDLVISQLYSVYDHLSWQTQRALDLFSLCHPQNCLPTPDCKPSCPSHTHSHACTSSPGSCTFTLPGTFLSSSLSKYIWEHIPGWGFKKINEIKSLRRNPMLDQFFFSR